VVSWLAASGTDRSTTVGPAGSSTPSIPPTASEAYSKGLYFLDRSPDELKKGLEYFRTAIALAPNFAAAYAGLGETHSSLGYAQYDGVPPEQAYAHAREAVRKALELDSTLPEAHVLLGKLQFKYEWNWTAADRTLRRAIQLNPKAAPARDAYFDYLFVLGRNAEASREVQRAALLNPVSLTTNYNVAMSLIGSADYDRAIDRFRRAIDLAPASAWALHMVGESYAEKGSWGEALAALEQSAELGPRSPHVISVLAWVQGMAGNRDAARLTLARLIALGETTYVSPHDVAVAQVGVGDYDGALTSLEQSYSRHDPWMSRLRVQTKLDPLRNIPQFQQLLTRLGLR
jgi:tetratricopeptide (TPR) repeat protein